MKRGLLIVSRKLDHPHEPDRIAATARARGIAVDTWFYEDIDVLFASDGGRVRYRGETVDPGQYAWCVPYTSHARSGSSADVKTLALACLMASGVRVLNGSSLVRYPLLSKARQCSLFVAARLPIAASQLMATFTPARVAHHLPLVAKKTVSSMGRAVHRVGSMADLSALAERYGAQNLLLQELLPEGEDYRVLVLGGASLGAMRRIAPPGSFLTNVEAGGRSEAAELTHEAASLAARVSAALELDFAGVDLMRHREGRLVVLEVNRHAHFAGFEAATGIDVAQRIVHHLLAPGEPATKEEASTP